VTALELPSSSWRAHQACASRSTGCARWTQSGQHELELPWERQADIAARCLAAARKCDVLWFLVPEAPSRGAWVELGAERIDERYPDDLRAFERLRALR